MRTTASSIAALRAAVDRFKSTDWIERERIAYEVLDLMHRALVDIDIRLRALETEGKPYVR